MLKKIEAWVIKKKGPMKVHGSMKKKRKKEKETPEGLEKKEREEEIAMSQKDSKRGRERPQKRSFHSIHHNPYTCTS